MEKLKHHKLSNVSAVWNTSDDQIPDYLGVDGPLSQTRLVLMEDHGHGVQLLLSETLREGGLIWLEKGLMPNILY